jgi:deazaflavin-dependent oxidoreductase (nitroreductase family)
MVFRRGVAMSVGLRILGLLALVVAGLAMFVRLVFVHEAVRRGLFPVLRPLYKRVFNPRALRDAARGDTRWAVLHHVGRRSGAAYDTPIDAQLTPEGAVIPLVCGPSVDWCRNVLAAGGCTLTIGGQDLAFNSPRVVPLSSTAAQLVPAKGRFWRSIGIERLLSLTTAPTGELESGAIPPDGGSDALRNL